MNLRYHFKKGLPKFQKFSTFFKNIKKNMVMNWLKVLENGPRKMCGRHPLKYLK